MHDQGSSRKNRSCEDPGKHFVWRLGNLIRGRGMGPWEVHRDSLEGVRISAERDKSDGMEYGGRVFL